ncbi:MAG TPA: class I SAM-dependent methyltransferase [Flavobacteriales bacterium]|nr:class I SAM-dependent methyltransferase [Flavobacteriales bacterium]
MKFTGERLTTDINGQIAIEHLHRYAMACELAKNKVVLDIASGEGYGSNLLASVASHVTGVDISVEAVKHASEKYTKKNIVFKQGSATKIPLENASVDIVTSFETIEHLVEHDVMLEEFKRVLKPGGILIISSPDKKYYTDMPSHENEFHLKELYENDFRELLGKNFAHCAFFNQGFAVTSFIHNEKQLGLDAYTGNFNQLESRKPSHIYNICIASSQPLPSINHSIFEGTQVYLRIEDYFTGKINDVYNSTSYKIGNAVVMPLKKITAIFKKK